jgi:hypothetical protein
MGSPAQSNSPARVASGCQADEQGTNEERYAPSAAHRRRQVAWLGIDAVLLVSSTAHQGDERHGRVRKGRR